MPHRTWSLGLVSVHVVSCGTCSGDAGVWKHHVDLKTSENSICLETKSCTATANEQKWIKMKLPQDAQLMRSIGALSFTKLISTWDMAIMPRRTSGQKRVALKPAAAHKNIDGGRFPGSHKAYAHTMCLSNKDTPWGKVPAAPSRRVTELPSNQRPAAPGAGTSFSAASRTSCGSSACQFETLCRSRKSGQRFPKIF